MSVLDFLFHVLRFYLVHILVVVALVSLTQTLAYCLKLVVALGIVCRTFARCLKLACYDDGQGSQWRRHPCLEFYADAFRSSDARAFSFGQAVYES